MVPFILQICVGTINMLLNVYFSQAGLGSQIEYEQWYYFSMYIQHSQSLLTHTIRFQLHGIALNTTVICSSCAYMKQLKLAFAYYLRDVKQVVLKHVQKPKKGCTECE